MPGGVGHSGDIARFLSDPWDAQHIANTLIHRGRCMKYLYASVVPGVPLYAHQAIPGVTQPGTVQLPCA